MNLSQQTGSDTMIELNSDVPHCQCVGQDIGLGGQHLLTEVSDLEFYFYSQGPGPAITECRLPMTVYV